MKLRLTSSGISGACQTRIVDAETGEPLDGVMAARWSHEGVDETPTLTLDLVDFECEATINGPNATFRRHKPGQPDSPRLMLYSALRLPPGSIQRIREQLGDIAARNAPVTVIDGLDVYQLVEGRWVPVDPRLAPASPEDLARQGITADDGE